MNIKDILVPLVSVAVSVLVVGVFLAPQDGMDGNDGLGASASPEVTQSTYFKSGVSYGGGCFATTTTGTLTVANLRSGCIDISPAGAGQAVLSLTLPTANAINGEFLPEVGMCRDWAIDASDVAAATTTTIVANTGVDVVGLDATGAGTGADVIDGAEFGRLTLCRQLGNGVTAYVHEYIAAD